MKNEDVELIRRFLADDEAAFAELVKKHQKPVHALAWRKIGDFHTAEEITQDAFLIVYQRLHTLKDPNLFSGWLYVITTHLCATWLRKKRIQTQPLEDVETKMLNGDAYSQHITEERSKTVGQAQRDVVKKLLAKLKESERTVMTLFYLGEMTVEEISRFLGVSAGTIKSRLQRARNRLQKEKTMIREALDYFQISPNLTDNILQEVARLKPVVPTASKPFVPWVVAASSAVLIVLLLGIGSNYLVRIQRPYSLDAQAEMSVELVDAPVVLNLDAKPDVRNQIGNTNSLSESDNSGQKPDEVIFEAAQAEGEDVSLSKQEWIPSEPMFGSFTDIFHATPEGDLYTLIPTTGKIYKLPANEETWQDISDISTLDHSGLGYKVIARWNDILYYTQSSILYASTDDGKTWDLLYSWEEKHQDPIALISTDDAFYFAFENGVFRSDDTGETWENIGDGLEGSINSLVEVQNTLFAGTNKGFYRLETDGWKRMEFPEAISQVYSVATNQKRVYILAELSSAVLNPQKVSRGHERGWGVFGTSNLGERWLDITPINAWAVNGFIPEAKLIAVGETLMLMERGMVRSNDGGITWLPTQLAGTSPDMDTINPAVAVGTEVVYVSSNDGLYRSTDSGKSWDMVNITPDNDKTGIYNLIVNTANDKGQNGLPTVYGKLVGAKKTTDNGKTWMDVPVEIPMAKPHKEQSPHINQIVISGSVIYASVDYDENGEKVGIYRLSTDGSRFVRIQEIPIIDSDYFEPLERTLLRNPTIEHLQENFSGATEFFKQLVKADNRIQNVLMREGLRGVFAVSDDTFYLEYNFKLFRWQRGDNEWYDTRQEETVDFSLDIAKQDLKLAASENAVYVGKRDGNLLASFDKGTNWLDFTPALPFTVNDFKEIVVAESTVYVATDGGVATSESGKNWRAITDSEEANLIMEHLAVDGTTLYGVNIKTGVYRLENGNWEQIISEIPDGITSLAVDGNTIFVGTESNGMQHFNLENK